MRARRARQSSLKRCEAESLATLLLPARAH